MSNQEGSRVKSLFVSKGYSYQIEVVAVINPEKEVVTIGFTDGSKDFCATKSEYFYIMITSKAGTRVPQWFRDMGNVSNWSGKGGMVSGVASYSHYHHTQNATLVKKVIETLEEVVSDSGLFGKEEFNYNWLRS